MSDNALTDIVESNAPVVDSTPPPLAAEPPGHPPEVIVDQPPDPAAMKAEIERLEAVKKKAEEDARYWRQEKARARAEYFKRDEKPPAPPVQDLGIGPEPRQADFEDYEKYLDAKISHETTKARVQWDREQAQRERDRGHQEKMGALQEKISHGFQKYQDFEEVALDPAVPITPLIGELLAECESPADVAYYLGKNRQEAIQLARMTPVQAARHLAKIELEIVRAGNPPPVKKISGAPPPINPLKISNPEPGPKDPDKMTQREYEDWRVSQGARRF